MSDDPLDKIARLVALGFTVYVEPDMADPARFEVGEEHRWRNPTTDMDQLAHGAHYHVDSIAEGIDLLYQELTDMWAQSEKK